MGMHFAERRRLASLPKLSEAIAGDYIIQIACAGTSVILMVLPIRMSMA